MLLMTLLLIILFAMGAAFVQRTTGFGFGIFIMTVLPYVLPSYGEATTLSGLLASVTSFILVVRYRKHIEWRSLIPILLTFMLVSFFAVNWLGAMHSYVLRRILGIVLICASIYFWFFAGKVRVGKGAPTQISLGTLSGLMGGFFGMQGPPAVLYFLQVSETKEKYTAIAQAYFLFGNMMMTVYRAHAGFLTHDVVSYWCWGLPAVLLGTYLGGLVFNHLSMPILRKIVYLYIGICGVVAIVS